MKLLLRLVKNMRTPPGYHMMPSCRQAATRPHAPWAQLDAVLWTVNFARARPKCRDHEGEERNGERASKVTREADPSRKWVAKEIVGKRYTPYARMPVCLRWNSRDGCIFRACRFNHCCSKCSSRFHREYNCMQLK